MKIASFLIIQEALNTFVEKAKAQTAMTHNQEYVLVCSEFFARTAVKVLERVKLSKAFEIVINEMPDGQILNQMVSKGLKTIPENWLNDMKAYKEIASLII